jgi:hypothetical protein
MAARWLRRSEHYRSRQASIVATEHRLKEVSDVGVKYPNSVTTLRSAKPRVRLNTSFQATLFTNGKPGGHRERSVKIGTINGGVGRHRRDRRQAVIPSARRARGRDSRSQGVHLGGRGVLLSRQGSGGAGRPDAELPGLQLAERILGLGGHVRQRAAICLPTS